MPAPNVPQIVLQYAPETVAGTLVPATRVVDVMPGSVKWNRDIKVIKVRNAGSYAAAHRAYPGQETTEVEWSAAATFDRLADYGNLFVATVATGTGTGATRTWTFTPSDTTDGLKRFSFEYGGTNFPQAYNLNGAVGKSLGISIKPNNVWEIKATAVGLATTNTAAVTSALSLPSTLGGDDVLWTQTKVYIDTTSAFGTTQQVGRIVSADFNITNGVDPRHTLDGAPYPYRVALAKERGLEATIVAEFDSAVQTISFASSTSQRVRLIASGPSSRSATIDIGGVWETATIGDDNGVVTTQLKLGGLYDASISADFKLTVVNGVTTLTTIP